MIVKRTIKMDADRFKVGDIIKFKLADGEKVKAMAVKEMSVGMLFVFVDSLAKDYPMFKSIDDMDEKDISYNKSDLRKALNGEIFQRFPEEIRNCMVAVNNEGDMLRIPTEREIFGVNVYGQEENETVKRWKSMKKRRNRIALQGKEGFWEWYWLMNRHKEYTSDFISVDDSINASYLSASFSLGVRPVFYLRQDNQELLNKEQCECINITNEVNKKNKKRKIVEINKVIQAVDKHTKEDGSLDEDISVILEEVIKDLHK